ncbi:hypothetical protein [Paraliobacillus zengyii]|uniref:hypothetical protein n=1 Tax=Paraliobacillus zengyii TaxID=2213194 RepID=UPI0013A6936F|nr:hypothetical protein [Paraliobacillus zengyii]
MTKNAERSISKQWKATWREAKEFLLPVGETLLDFTRDVLPDVKDGIEDVTEWFEELDEEGKKNIIMLGGIAAAAGPVLSVVGGISSGVGGLIKITGGLSKVLGIAGGKGLLGRIGLMGITGGPVGLAIAGIGGLSYGIYELSKSMNQNTEDTLKSIESRKEEIESVDELIEQFVALQEKNKLSTDEMLRYMDVADELKEAKTEEAIEKLKDEQAELLEKSTLTNDEMRDFLELNEDVVEKSPSTASAISEQGNAYAEVLEELEKLNNAEKQRLIDDTYDAITAEMDKQKENLKEQKTLQQEIAAKELEREDALDRLSELSEQIKDKDLEIADIKKDLLTLTGNERLELAEKLLQEEEARKLLIDQKGMHDQIITGIDTTIAKKEKSLEETQKELNAFETLIGEYEAIILKQSGVNAEKGQGLKTVQKEIDELNKQKGKLDELKYSGELNTQEYQDQIGMIDSQIGKLEDAQKELRTMNELAGKTIYQDHNVTVKFYARYSGFKQGDSANIGLVGGGGHVRQYATGTDHHPGGIFLAGEEGFELGRLGNQWEMLGLGMYDRPSGYQVFTHDESKNIMKAFNPMPGYATGISPAGEADRIVSNLRNNPFNKLLALLGKQSNSSGQTNRSTKTAVDYTKDLLNATLQQNEILMQLLAKDINPIIDSRSLGKGLEPVITETQNRKQKVREKFGV